MLSARTLWRFKTIPTVLSLLHKPKITREILIWNTIMFRTLSSIPFIFPPQSCRMCSQAVSFQRRGNAFERRNLNNALRGMSSRRNGNNSTHSKVVSQFINPDTGDIDDDHSPVHTERSSGTKIKVKFNWKNSMVSTDAVFLLENLYKTHPQLIEFDEGSLVSYLQRMSTYAIDVEKSSKMVIMCPSLLKTSDSKLTAAFNALRSIGLNESQQGHVVRIIPELLNFPPKRIVQQFTFLKTYFTKDETIDAICKSVEVFLETEATLKPKLEYLIREMSHETKNIVSSKALSYSLRHMKTRHEFLIRSGLFKPIPYRKMIKVLEKEYKDKNKSRSKYFRPIEIVCYNDEDFIKTCTKNLLTLNEFVAFEELYNAELDVLDDIDGEDEMYEDTEEDDDESEINDAVSLVKASNSSGFFNDVEAKSCYF